MEPREQLRKAWDQGHQNKPLGGAAHELIEIIVRRVPVGTSFLDAGCGRGRNSFALYEAGYDIYGCDFSPAAIGVAHGHAILAGQPLRFVVADLTCTPFMPNRFAGILSTRVLPYLYREEIARSLSELWRVLSSGGWLYFDLLACDDAEYGCGPELEPGTFLDPDGVPVHFSSRQEVVELAAAYDQVQIERIEIGSPAKRRVTWAVWVRK